MCNFFGFFIYHISGVHHIAYIYYFWIPVNVFLFFDVVFITVFYVRYSIPFLTYAYYLTIVNHISVIVSMAIAMQGSSRQDMLLLLPKYDNGCFSIYRGLVPSLAVVFRHLNLEKRMNSRKAIVKAFMGYQYRDYRVTITYIHELVQIAYTIFGFLASATGIIMSIDFGRKLTVIEIIYFIAVTIATIGYGDIAPTTNIGRMFIILLIILTMIVVPIFITFGLRRLLHERRYFLVNQTTHGEVAVIGEQTISYTTILRLALRPQVHLGLIDVLQAERQSLVVQEYAAVTSNMAYIALQENDELNTLFLKKVGLHHAKTILFLSPIRSGSNPDILYLSTLINISRLVDPSCRLIVLARNPMNNYPLQRFLKPVHEVLTVLSTNEIFSRLVILSVLFPGLSTFIINMLLGSNLFIHRLAAHDVRFVPGAPLNPNIIQLFTRVQGSQSAENFLNNDTFDSLLFDSIGSELLQSHPRSRSVRASRIVIASESSADESAKFLASNTKSRPSSIVCNNALVAPIDDAPSDSTERSLSDRETCHLIGETAHCIYMNLLSPLPFRATRSCKGRFVSEAYVAAWSRPHSIERHTRGKGCPACNIVEGPVYRLRLARSEAIDFIELKLNETLNNAPFLQLLKKAVNKFVRALKAVPAVDVLDTVFHVKEQCALSQMKQRALSYLGVSTQTMGHDGVFSLRQSNIEKILENYEQTLAELFTPQKGHAPEHKHTLLSEHTLGEEVSVDSSSSNRFKLFRRTPTTLYTQASPTERIFHLHQHFSKNEFEYQSRHGSLRFSFAETVALKERDNMLVGDRSLVAFCILSLIDLTLWRHVLDDTYVITGKKRRVLVVVAQHLLFIPEFTNNLRRVLSEASADTASFVICNPASLDSMKASGINQAKAVIVVSFDDVSTNISGLLNLTLASVRALSVPQILLYTNCVNNTIMDSKYGYTLMYTDGSVIPNLDAIMSASLLISSTNALRVLSILERVYNDVDKFRVFEVKLHCERHRMLTAGGLHGIFHALGYEVLFYNLSELITATPDPTILVFSGDYAVVYPHALCEEK